jgi:hypothetical protein
LLFPRHNAHVCANHHRAGEVITIVHREPDSIPVQALPGKIEKVELLGNAGTREFTQDAYGLRRCRRRSRALLPSI